MSYSVPPIAVHGEKSPTIPVPAIKLRTRRETQISGTKWQCIKARIEELYGSLTLDNLIETIERETTLSATRRQYKWLIQKWGLKQKRSLGTGFPDHEISTSMHGSPSDDKTTPPVTESRDSTRELDYELDVELGHSIGYEPNSQCASGIGHHNSGYHSNPLLSSGTGSHDSGYYSTFSSQSTWEPRSGDCPIRGVSHGEWDNEGLFHETTTSQSQNPNNLCGRSRPVYMNLAHDVCLTGLVMSPSPAKVLDHERLDFSTATVQPGSSSPTVTKTTQGGSITPTGDVYDSLSGVSDNWFNECSSSPDVDIFIDLYRGPLFQFLHWIETCHTPHLVIRFETGPLSLSPWSSLRSHTTRDSSNESSATLGGLTPISTQGSSNANGKRKFSSADGPAGQEVQLDEEASQSPTIPKKRKIKLACHFHKLNASKFSRGRYKTCPNGFDGLNRLKDHQTYVHRPAHYCKRCKRIFSTQDLRDAHDDQDERCQRREDPAFADYLTSDVQRAALARKKPAGMKDEDFWYEMWDKYFPGVSRPASAFQDLDPTLAAFQRFAEREAVSTVQAYCEFNPTHGLTMEELTHFWHFAIYYIVAGFASQQGYQSYPSSVEPGSSQQHQQPDGMVELLESSAEIASFIPYDLDPIGFPFDFADG